jgi:hypothetical protein
MAAFFSPNARFHAYFGLPRHARTNQKCESTVKKHDVARKLQHFTLPTPVTFFILNHANICYILLTATERAAGMEPHYD